MLRAALPGCPLQNRTVVQWDIGAVLKRDGAADEFSVFAVWYKVTLRENKLLRKPLVDYKISSDGRRRPHNR